MTPRLREKDCLVQMVDELRALRPPVYDADQFGTWIAGLRETVQALPRFDQRWASVALVADDLAKAEPCMPLGMAFSWLARQILTDADRAQVREQIRQAGAGVEASSSEQGWAVMENQSQNGWLALVNPVTQDMIVVLLVTAALWLAMQVPRAGGGVTMALLFWLALGVACVAVGIVLLGWGYLVGLQVAARRVATVREKTEEARESRRTMVRQEWA